MPVPTSINDLSVTASSNSPAGGDSVGSSLDDFLRAIQAILKESGGTLYTASGTNTITFNTTPTFASYTTGQRFFVKAAGANTGAVTVNINGLGAKNVYKNGSTALSSGDISAAGCVFLITYDGTQFQLDSVKINAGTSAGNMVQLDSSAKLPAVDGSQLTGISAGDYAVQDLRLTLTTATPVTTSDVTAATTLYLTPYKGKQIGLYSGTAWSIINTAEVSLALGTITSGKPYDVFAYDNAGTVTLEILAWTNDTTRATALAYQDGVLVKSGVTTRRYLGTFYTTSATTTEDSAANRYLWNYYNRICRPMSRVDTTDSWTYSSASWRQANGSTANQLNFVIGVVEDCFEAISSAYITNSSGACSIAAGVGVNSTTVNSAKLFGGASTSSGVVGTASAYFNGYPSTGKNYAAWLELTEAFGTTTFYGDAGGSRIQTGITGSVFA